MSREQRAEDNWALLHAVQLASELGDGAIVKVVFNLVPKFLEATLRQYGFMIAGLKETEAALREKHIPMILLKVRSPCPVHTTVQTVYPSTSERLTAPRALCCVPFAPSMCVALVCVADADGIVVCFPSPDAMVVGCPGKSPCCHRVGLR
jgi:hypothetical protein